MKKPKLRLKKMAPMARRLARLLVKSQILTIFLVLCVLGIWVGFQTRPRPDATRYAELFDNMSVVSYRESPSDTTARFVVQLAACGKVFSQYDVDARAFLPPTRGRPYSRTITGTHYRPLRVRGHVAYGFWLDVPDSARHSLLPEQFDELYRTTLDFVKPVSLVASALGILSGYSVGYRLGTWNSSLCSHAVQERLLATPGLGRTIAREAWRRVLLEPVVMTDEDDAARFAAVAGTHRLYSNFFRVALDDSNGFVPREADRLAQLGRPYESRAMLAFAAAVRRAALDSVDLASTDFDAVERWASLLDRRGHWAQGAIPPPGAERIQLLGTLAWYGLAPPAPKVDRVWVGPRMLVREGDTEGFVADEIPGSGTGCPISWRSRLREERTGTSAMANAWLADRPEFTALAELGERVASGLAGAGRQIAKWRPRAKTPPARSARVPSPTVPATFTSGTNVSMAAPADSLRPRAFTYPFRTLGRDASVVLIVADSAEAAPQAHAAQATVIRVDSLMGNGNANSEVQRLNRQAAVGPAPVDPEVAFVIGFARRVWRESERAFDITAEPLKRIWGLTRGPRRVPPQQAVDAALRRVGVQQVAFDSTARTLGFLRPGVRIDLGGISDGYAVDAAAETLRARGVRNALLELSGNTVTLGAPVDGDRWSIVLADPRGRIPGIARLRLAPGQTMSSSGRYDPYVMADGRTYGSIMDPRTGHPAEGLIAVAALAPNAMTANAWSTALFVLGPAEAKRQVRERADLSAVLIEPGPEGIDIIWIDADLKDRFILDKEARALFRVETF